MPTSKNSLNKSTKNWATEFSRFRRRARSFFRHARFFASRRKSSRPIPPLRLADKSQAKILAAHMRSGRARLFVQGESCRRQSECFHLFQKILPRSHFFASRRTKARRVLLEAPTFRKATKDVWARLKFQTQSCTIFRSRRFFRLCVRPSGMFPDAGRVRPRKIRFSKKRLASKK